MLNFVIMKRNTKSLALIISVLLFSAAMMLGFDSCKKKTEEESVRPTPHEPWSPDPVNGELPESVLPAELKDVIGQYFTIYSGDNPAHVHGEFVSSPHALIATSLDTNYVYPDSAIFYHDRYLLFEEGYNGTLNFFGKQWDDSLYYSYADQQWHGGYYEEAYRDLKSVGNGDNFTCYYLTDGYPGGYYALQSTIFSAIWNDTLGGLKDFQVAVILLETSGNPDLDPVNSYRVLGDFDSLARNNAWADKKAPVDNSVKVDDYGAFRMFRKK